jgi:hypothetical protein
MEEAAGMFEEFLRLRADPKLFQLLEHYARAGSADREAWQDRVMQLADLPPKDLANLHGELLAYSWIEQNTGIVSILRAAAVPQCYRITSGGQKALKLARAGQEADDENAEAA